MRLTAGMLLAELPVPFQPLHYNESAAIYRIRKLGSIQEAEALAPNTLGILPTPCDMEVSPGQSCCVICVHPEDAEVCLPYLEEFLCENHRRTTYLEDLYQAVSARASLEEVLSVAGVLLGAPVVVLDAAGIVLGSSEHCTLPVIQQLQLSALQGTGLSVNSAEEEASLVMPITGSRDTIGYVGVPFLHPRAYKLLDKAFLEQIARLLIPSLELGITQNRIGSRQAFLQALLQGTLSDPAQVRMKMEELRISPANVYYVLTIPLENKTLTHYDMQELYAGIGTEVYLCDGYCTAVLERNFANYIQASDFPELVAWLNKNDLYAGLSQGYLSLSQTRYAFHQSKEIIPLRRRISYDTIRFARYEDLQLGHMMHILQSQGIPLSSFVHPSLARIWNYDQGKNTEYFKTLVNYVICSKSLAATANSLFLHKNTVYYRLRVLQDEFNIDFNDMRLLLKVYIAGSVYNYMQPQLLDTLRTFEPDL